MRETRTAGTLFGQGTDRWPEGAPARSGAVHAPRGLPTLDALLGHPVAGGSWEGFVIENLLAAAPRSAQGWFYRTSAGAEIDLLIETASAERWAIEVKGSSAPSVSRGFRSGCDDVGAVRRLAVYPGAESFPLPGDVDAVSLLDAVRLLREAGGPAREDLSGAGDA